MHANLNLQKNEWRVGPDETVQVVNSKEKKLQEFYGDKEDQTNWRSIIFALAVITTVLTAVIFAVMAMGPLDDAAAWFHNPLTLDEVLQEKRTVEAKQIHNTVFLGDSVSFLDADGGISVFNPASKTTRSLVPSSVIRQLNVQKYNPSMDQKFVLLLHDKTYPEGGWREYYRYSVFVTADNYHFPLRFSPSEVESSLLQNAKWAGNSSHLIFVYNNDIYYRENPLNGTSVQVTTDGSSSVFNGVPDWLYHESLDLKEMLWSSASGTYFAFAKVDASTVDEEDFILFGQSSPKSYQKVRSLRYPKAGTTLPVVSVVVVNLKDQEVLKVIFPTNITGSDSYLRDVSWTNDRTMTMAWTSRAHSVTSVISCTAPDFVCQDIYVERVQTQDQWLSKPLFIASPKGLDEIVFIDEVADRKGVAYNQVLHIRSPHHRATPLKHEGISVVSLVGWDEERNCLYFAGAPEVRPYERHIYRISDANDLENSDLFCITCANETVHDDDTLPFSCSFYEAYISASCNYMVAECLGPTVPYTTIYSLENGSIVKEVNKESEVRVELLSGLLWRERRYVFYLADGSVGHVQVLLPLKWKDSIHGRIQFPMVIEIPERPENFEITSEWKRGWDMYQALGLQTVYARMSGSERRHTLGSVLLAAQDIITMVKGLLREVRFIDEQRIAVWGRGFGGYVATSALATSNHQIRCAIAIAPVSNWLTNDAASSERYLGLPSQAYQSYVLGDLTRTASQVPDSSYLLIHGSFADPVHMQQSMSLAKALTEAGVQFEQQIYPDTDYRLTMAEKQMYATMNSFLQKCYQNSVVY